MNLGGIMKNIIFVAALLLSATSFAKSQKPAGVIEFAVTKAVFSKAHISNPGAATITVDYSNSKARLMVVSESTCPVGMACAIAMPAPLIVELPITSVESDDCGIVTVTAQQDSRPVDGSLQELKVTDASQMTCKTFIAVFSEAHYKTSYYDRRNGKKVEDVSKMTLAKVLPDSSAVKILLKYQQNSGFSPRPSNQVITVDSKGKVSSLETFSQDNTSKKIDIAQLSSASMKTLKAQIATVKGESQLVDENENQPRCMDAPSTTVSIVKADQDLVISAWESCHTYKLYEGDAVNLANLMNGFATLAR